MARKGRNPNAYARRPPRREPYDSVLIVCEGAKTEPLYFKGLLIAHQLSSANIHVMSADGSDPMSIVSFAEAQMAKVEADGVPYDKVFCVFDRNGHAQYNEALRRVASSNAGRAGKLRTVTSWPCFELWLLLHYRYSAAPFAAVGGESSCDRAMRELRTYMPNYRKGTPTVFADTAAKLNDAMRWARQLKAHNVATGSLNPATSVHELVEYLMALRG
jgi:hypothetical protein